MEQPTRLTGAEERKTGQSYLGHNTMNNQGKTSPEYSMEVSQWSSPEREALRSIRLTAAPTQKGVPVPTSCINQPEGRSMRISSDPFHWGKHQSLHIAEQWTSGFANVARTPHHIRRCRLGRHGNFLLQASVRPMVVSHWGLTSEHCRPAQGSPWWSASGAAASRSQEQQAPWRLPGRKPLSSDSYRFR